MAGLLSRCSLAGHEVHQWILRDVHSPFVLLGGRATARRGRQRDSVPLASEIVVVASAMLAVEPASDDVAPATGAAALLEIKPADAPRVLHSKPRMPGRARSKTRPAPQRFQVNC